MASPAHGLDVCFLHGGDDDQDAHVLPLPVMEESDGDCSRQVRPDMSAAEPMDHQCSNQVFRSSRQKRSQLGS